MRPNNFILYKKSYRKPSRKPFIYKFYLLYLKKKTAPWAFLNKKERKKYYIYKKVFK